MRNIDASAAGNIATLAKLSIAFGVAGSVFLAKYAHDAYYGEEKSDAVSYMLPIGMVFLCISLLLSPAVYKSILPKIRFWIETGERIIGEEIPSSPTPGIWRLKVYTKLFKFLKFSLLCLYPIFILILVSGVLVWL